MLFKRTVERPCLISQTSSCFFWFLESVLFCLTQKGESSISRCSILKIVRAMQRTTFLRMPCVLFADRLYGHVNSAGVAAQDVASKDIHPRWSDSRIDWRVRMSGIRYPPQCGDISRLAVVDHVAQSQHGSQNKIPPSSLHTHLFSIFQVFSSIHNRWCGNCHLNGNCSALHQLHIAFFYHLRCHFFCGRDADYICFNWSIRADMKISVACSIRRKSPFFLSLSCSDTLGGYCATDFRGVWANSVM